MSILEIWNSDVNRWHASRCHALRNSGDTTDAHAARCCRLLLALKPDASANLIAATLHHDVAERVTGDTPMGAKRDATLRDTLVRLEIAETMRLRLSEAVTAEEADWIKLVDRLDAYLWCAMVAPAELRRDDWADAYCDILDRAKLLDVYDAVFMALHGAHNRSLQ
jgi:5'-deoxynucleotidase YfbR-like HD superfamily hydrolase